jgi:hypothetical protein
VSGDGAVPGSPAGGPQPDTAPSPPRTGIEQVDEVTQRLADLPDIPLSEHHDRLAEAQAVLHDALHAEPTPPQPG